MKTEAKIYFATRFVDPIKARPTMNGVDFMKFSSMDSLKHEEEFTLEEIKEVIRDSEGDRSPDPNGFNFYFLRKC